ncbi:hypothetical protein [Limnohabitans sp.]|uniref:hypothetical protein n=1 Tax=Limnohabitans sp. TaxID=1907725 RepID=UPI0039BC4D76
MLLAVVIAKSLIELSLMFIVGRFLLGLLAGAKRDTNVFYQLLDVASKPALWLTRKISPKLILDQHIPLATSSWLLIAWVVRHPGSESPRCLGPEQPGFQRIERSALGAGFGLF